MMKKLKTILLIMAVVVLTIVLSAACCTVALTVTEYDVPIEGFEKKAKIVCIADLHSHSYGKDNEQLIAKVAEQNPDAIFVIGDMINADATEAEVADMISLIKKLGDIAQVYFSPGNQEMDYMIDLDESLMEQVSETGAIALLDEYVETELNGNIVRIGGSIGHYYRWTKEQWEAALDYVMEAEIGSTDIPALILFHMPESMLLDGPEEWTGDFYFCAHTHGGVIRIPGIGGLYAPTQAWFPEYDKGLYHAHGHDLIITSGLSGYKGVPRIFNMPEVCVVNITPR